MLKLTEAIMGPVFVKEMLQVGRRGQTFLARLALSLLLAAFFVIHGTQTTITQANLARVANDIFWAVLITSYTTVYFLVPAILAGVVAGERERGTLDLVLMSDVGIRELAYGKVLSRLAAVCLLLIVAVPFLSLVGLFGGIDYSALFWGIVSTLQTTLLVASITFYASATSRGTLAALIRAYVWMIVLFLIIPFLFLVLGAMVPSGAPLDFGRFWSLQGIANPIGRFPYATDPMHAKSIATRVGPYAFPIVCSLDLVVSLLIFWFATNRIRLEIRPRKQRRWLRFSSRARMNEKLPTRDRWLATLRKKNPFWYRGYISRCYDPEGYIRRVWFWSWPFVALLSLIVAFSENDSWISVREILSALFLFVLWFVSGLLGLVVAATSIVGDRRRGFWEQILVTPLTASQCIDGVFLAVLEHVWRFWLFPVLLTIEALCLGIFNGVRLVGAAMTAVLCAITLCQVGVVLSSAAPSMGRALFAALAFLLIVGFGVPVLSAEMSPEFAAWIRLYAPLPFLLFATFLALRRRPGAWLTLTFLVVLYLLCILLVTDLALWRPLIGTMLAEQTSLSSIHPISAIATASLPAYIGYWLGLVLFMALVRIWAIRKFDDLNGRGTAFPASCVLPIANVDAGQGLAVSCPPRQAKIEGG